MRIALIFLLLTLPAYAHDSWLNQFKNPMNPTEFCCGVQDCEEVADVTEVKGGYRIRLATWVVDIVSIERFTGRQKYEKRLRFIDEVVPYQEVLPSQDGRIWRCRRPNGDRRCFFMPLPLT